MLNCGVVQGARIAMTFESNRSKHGVRKLSLNGAQLGVAFCVLMLTACANPRPTEPMSEAKATATLDLAHSERAAGNVPQAIAHYRSALQQNPNLPVEVSLDLGDLLLDTNADFEAADVFRKAQVRSPDDPRASVGLGTALVALDQPLPAVLLLRKGLASSPNPRGFRALGIAEDLLDRFDDAVTDCQKGLALFPSDSGLREDLGISQALDGDFKSAIATMRIATAAPHATARDRLNLALVLGLAGKLTESRQASSADLDDRAAHANAAYYKRLRALPPTLRAEALLHPFAAAATQPAH
jgi:Flp pilus assembly protein TadD